MLKFTIEGEPQGKARPRVTRGGKHTYTPKKTKDYQGLVQMLAPKEYLEGPLKMEIIAYFKIPKSKSKKIKALMESGDIRPTKKPDYDNIGKIIADSLNGISYKDDSQIVRGTVEKWYSYEPRVEVFICKI